MTDTFTTSRGVSVEFVGIAPLLDKLNGQLHLPEAPYYEAKTAGGVVEKHEHDDSTVSTPEEKAALEHYRAETARLNAEHQARLTKLVLLKGIRFAYPESDEWVKEQSYLGIDVPADSIARRLHYIETEVIANAADVEQITIGVMRASGVPEDLLTQMEATFQRSLGKRNGHETSGPTETTDAGEMVLQSEVRASDSSVQDGQIHERIRRGKRRGQGVRDCDLPGATDDGST